MKIFTQENTVLTRREHFSLKNRCAMWVAKHLTGLSVTINFLVL